jgi:hypothetical protein
MLGYVASMTYDNPHILLQDTGGVLKGIWCARLQKDMIIKFGKMQGIAAVGHIAFTSGVTVRRLKKGHMDT